MSESWDDYAETWDTGAPVLYADGAAASLKREAIAVDGLRVLDFGCGTGLLSERMVAEGATIVALDPSTGMIAKLREKNLERVQAVQGALDDLPESEPFDLIVASSVCAFMPNYPETVRKLAQRLKPGGAFVQWDWEYNAEDKEPYGLTRDAIREALSGAELEVSFLGTGFELTFEGMTMAPLMGVGRRR